MLAFTLCSFALLNATAQDKSTEKASTEMTAAEKADNTAKELANPNTSYASLTLKTQYRTFKGDLPGADSQTLMLGGRPWKFSFKLNYYVEQPDAFGPESMIGFNHHSRGRELTRQLV